jgi:hypothetical protein
MLLRGRRSTMGSRNPSRRNRGAPIGTKAAATESTLCSRSERPRANPVARKRRNIHLAVLTPQPDWRGDAPVDLDPARFAAMSPP